MKALLGSWRLPLRIARRDALRHRGRSILVLVMIALPVLAVTTADVLMQTSDVSGVESIDRRMGTAEALVTTSLGSGRVVQTPDPEGSFFFGDEGGELPMPTADQVSAALGGARLVERREGEARVRTDNGAVTAGLTEVDLADPLAEGLFDLRSGRLPRDPGEVVVNEALADKGYGVGETLDRPGAGQVDPIVVGVAESTTTRDFPTAAGPLGAFGLETDNGRQWLVGGDPVAWSTVLELNELGATVASRAVISDPPPESEWAPEAQGVTSGSDDATVAILVLIVVMALMEVVLLAGPSFAVGARKQQRTLALMSAAGGTPVQARRVILGSAVVLGSVAASLGVVLGIGLARLLVPVVQSRSGQYLGPFDVPWLHLAGIAVFGLISAFLAAVVPAYLASRQDVVAVLAGRRGDPAPSLKSPVLGLVLLGAGIAGSVVGATGGGEIMIAASAIPAVLGMILLVPLVLAGLGRVSGRLPLVLRYAVRDAARHRTRTVPAVAAVAATVAGVVALGVGLTSDQEEAEQTYTASLADGFGVITSYGAEPSWDAYRAAVQREAPEATVTQQLGVADLFDDERSSYTEVTAPGTDILLSSYGSSLGASVLVSDDRLPAALAGVDDGDRSRAEQALRDGGAVAFYSGDTAPTATTVRIVQHVVDNEGENLSRNSAEVTAAYVKVDGETAGPAAVISTAAAQAMGVEPAVVGLVTGRDELSTDQESAVQEALGGIDDTHNLYVERGFQADDEVLIAQLILIGLGGVLMLGGTLTATFLALSDARPDLATLSAVGASPRTRRGVAAAYAVVVGFVGAVLGAAVGFIPGIAVTYPLTSQNYGTMAPDGSSEFASGPFLDVPWLMIIGLVVALPLVTAAVVASFARSRLPLVARLD